MASIIDMVTLDNFEAKMARWDPENKSHLYALVDMGSNGIRFSISDLSPPRARLLKCVYKERAAISLFDALHAGSGDSASQPLTFPQETIALVARTLARFRAIAVDDFDVPPSHVAVFATEAMRRAANAGAMLEAIHAAAPELTVQVLAPEVETLFGAVGARSSFLDVKGLLLDLGGGSVQMTYMDTQEAREATNRSKDQGYEVEAAMAGESLPFGAARLIRVLEAADTNIWLVEKTKLENGMRIAFEKLRSRFPALAATVAAASESNDGNTGIDVYLCGGGFRGYGYMLMHNDPIQPYPIPTIGTYTVSGARFCETRRMMEVNTTHKGKIFGLSKRRRAQFPAIVRVIEALIDTVPRIRSVTFCAGGNREGALMMKLPKEIRESNPMSLLPHNVSNLLSAGSEDQSVRKAVEATLRSAVASVVDLERVDTVFKLHLTGLFVPLIWHRIGESDEANAAAALHDAVTRDPSRPVLTQLARAILAVTLCERWGRKVAPADEQLLGNLKKLIVAADPDALFWAEYIGATAATVAKLLPAWPKTVARLENSIRFKATAEQGAKKLKITVIIFLGDSELQSVEAETLESSFEAVGKSHSGKKVTVAIRPMTEFETTV